VIATEVCSKLRVGVRHPGRSHPAADNPRFRSIRSRTADKGTRRLRPIFTYSNSPLSIRAYALARLIDISHAACATLTSMGEGCVSTTVQTLHRG